MRDDSVVNTRNILGRGKFNVRQGFSDVEETIGFLERNQGLRKLIDNFRQKKSLFIHRPLQSLKKT